MLIEITTQYNIESSALDAVTVRSGQKDILYGVQVDEVNLPSLSFLSETNSQGPVWYQIGNLYINRSSIVSVKILGTSGYEIATKSGHQFHVASLPTSVTAIFQDQVLEPTTTVGGTLVNVTTVESPYSVDVAFTEGYVLDTWQSVEYPTGSYTLAFGFCESTVTGLDITVMGSPSPQPQLGSFPYATIAVGASIFAYGNLYDASNGTVDGLVEHTQPSKIFFRLTSGGQFQAYVEGDTSIHDLGPVVELSSPKAHITILATESLLTPKYHYSAR